MTARTTATRDQIASWVASEGCVNEWGVEQPYGGRNLSGCHDLFLAREGFVLLVWVRPASDPSMTASQQQWARRSIGQTLSPKKPYASSGPISGLLVWPSADALDAARDVLK